MDLITIFSYLFLILILYLAFNKSKVIQLIKAFAIRNQKFKCNDCSDCCKYVVKLSDIDIKRIKTDNDYIEETKNGKQIKLVNSHCIFLDNNKKKLRCKIYDMRPDTCRRYPEGRLLGIKLYDLLPTFA